MTPHAIADGHAIFGGLFICRRAAATAVMSNPETDQDKPFNIRIQTCPKFMSIRSSLSHLLIIHPNNGLFVFVVQRPSFIVYPLHSIFYLLPPIFYSMDRCHPFICRSSIYCCRTHIIPIHCEL